VWLALIILTLVIFGASLPVYVAQLHTPCAGSACWFTQLAPGQVEALQGIGLSLDDYVAYMVALTLASVMVCLLVSTLIVWRRADDRMALFVALMLVVFGPISATSSVMASSSPWQVFNEGLTFLALSLLVLVFLLFPSGQFVPQWTRWLLTVFLVGLVPERFVGPSMPNTPVDQLGFLVVLSELATLAFVQLYRYRHVSDGVQRQQTKWVVFFIAVMGIFSATTGVGAFLFSVFAGHGSLYTLAFNVVGVFFPFFFPLSFGFAMLRSRLWEIDLIINRTLVYGILTATVVAVYVLMVGILGALLHTSGNVLISLLATGLIAVLFQPLRLRLQRLVNRLTYGERDEPYAVLSRLLNRLEATLAPEAVLPTIVETVAQALKLPYSALALKQGEAFITAAAYGPPQPDPFIVPLVYQAETIGLLHLAPRAPGEAFTPADRRLLADLAHQAGIAAHAVQLTADLQRSRERLVTAREEERRRLRRDLHDGLGPTLASMTLKLDAARNLLTQQPAAVDPLLVEVKAQLQATIADIRRLVYDLRPPALDELGLVPALREQALQYHHLNGLQVTIEAPPQLPTLPAAVEVAAYRIALEGMTNVSRHAQAHTCSVRLQLADTLMIEVSDDGQGLPSQPPVGVGLASMRERAAELGGSCVVTKGATGGTRVLAQLPLVKE
jgi:signal transduction histidine kinase